MTDTLFVPVLLPSGTELTLPVHVTGSVRDVSDELPKAAADVIDAINEFGQLLRRAAEACSPDSLDIAFSLGFELKAGKLTALVVEGAANGGVTITLHWGRDR